MSSLKCLTEYEEMCVLNKSFHLLSHVAYISTEKTFSSSFSPSNNIQDQYLIISDIYGVRERARG